MNNTYFRLVTLVVAFALGVSAVALLRNGGSFSSARSSSTRYTSSTKSSSGIEEEEYAVYSALLNENTGSDNKERLVGSVGSVWVS